ncbi:MAG: multiprotein bridging factor aMBF1 [Nitrososphaerota archaeon]|nr:multiprotein bridging factor aMBF1 [Nitrososphaerales archaeon]MDW8044419.1 multiprotein bridging factor aMBF1 [Nitrososphaerota archaeon]
MSARCEICGRAIHGQTVNIEVDGAVFIVCNMCSKLGSPVKVVKKAQPSIQTPSTVKHEFKLELRKDYFKVIKQARERIGLTQEQLSRKINEKLSVIKLLESGKLKPDDILARKIEHTLKVELLVPVEGE